jgi:hypothetical protein
MISKFESIQLLHLFSFDRKETTIYSIDISLKSHDARTQTSKAAEKGHWREKERNQYGKEIHVERETLNGWKSKINLKKKILEERPSHCLNIMRQVAIYLKRIEREMRET